MTLVSLPFDEHPRAQPSFTRDTINQVELARSLTSRASGNKKDMSSTRGDLNVQSCTRGGKKKHGVKRLVCSRGWFCQTKFAGGYSRFHGPINHRSQLLSLKLSVCVSREAVFFKSQELENT